jgi:hypothetical protein
MVARAQGLEHGRGGRHARGEEEGSGSALECRQEGFGRGIGGTAVAGVVEPAAVGVVGVAEEGRAGMDRRDDGAAYGIDRSHRLGQQCLGLAVGHGA